MLNNTNSYQSSVGADVSYSSSIYQVTLDFVVIQLFKLSMKSIQLKDQIELWKV